MNIYKRRCICDSSYSVTHPKIIKGLKKKEKRKKKRLAIQHVKATATNLTKGGGKKKMKERKGPYQVLNFSRKSWA